MITFPQFSGTRCLMMPYIQGDPSSVPDSFNAYRDIIDALFVRRGDVGYLTIDESPATRGVPHRGARAKYGRALHTEAGLREVLCWGSGDGSGSGWGSSYNVMLEPEVCILVASNISDSCAIWDATHRNTSFDGDIGNFSDVYPYGAARFLKAGEVAEIGILTPHESLPIQSDCNRQFLRIVSSGVHGREPYFTENPLLRTA